LHLDWKLKSRVISLSSSLAPNDVCINPTAQLTSRRCILNIYSTNILTEYFKHAAHSLFFLSLQDAVYFIMLSFLVPLIFTFYIQGVLKFIENSGAKRLDGADSLHCRRVWREVKDFCVFS
jgi:hypothetical protein